MDLGTAAPTTINDAVHVVHGSFALAADCEFIWLKDSLNIGPCDVDPDQHAEQRREYWIEFDRTMLDVLPDDSRTRRLLRESRADLNHSVFGAQQLLKRLEESPDTPVVLWVTSDFGDLLSFLWTLDSVTRSSLHPNRFWIAKSVYREDDTDWPLGAHSEHRLRAAFKELFPLNAKVLSRGSSLWRSYAGQMPLEFDQQRRTDFGVGLALASATGPYGFAFPRAAEDGRLRLSPLDQFLLGSLDSSEWRRPIDVITQAISQETALHWSSGNAVLAYRLRQWAGHEPDRPFVRSQFRKDGGNTLTRVAYRLTERGGTCAREGMNDITDAPPMFVGGCRVYDTESPWVRRDTAQGFAIERL